MRRAFTLVELLIVIAIVAVLIALILPTLSLARRSARETKCRANLESIAQLCDLYRDAWKMYPRTWQALEMTGDGTDAAPGVDASPVRLCPLDRGAVDSAGRPFTYNLWPVLYPAGTITFESWIDTGGLPGGVAFPLPAVADRRASDAHGKNRWLAAWPNTGKSAVWKYPGVP